MDRQLFDAVQQKLRSMVHEITPKPNPDHLLTGLLFDDAGHQHDPDPRYQNWNPLPLLRLAADLKESPRRYRRTVSRISAPTSKTSLSIGE